MTDQQPTDFQSIPKGPRLVEHAAKQLVKHGLFDRDADFDGQLGIDVMELVMVFSKQGHSGMSAERVIELFLILIKRKDLA